MIRFVVFEVLVFGFGVLLIVNGIRCLTRSRQIGRSVLQGYQAARPAVWKWWYGPYRFYEKLTMTNTSPASVVTGAILGLITGLFLLALGVLGIVMAIRSYY